MATVTKLTLRSGDRVALDAVVEELRSVARRKGADLRGPHSDSPTVRSVPQYKRLDGEPGETFDSWEYTVYSRRMEIHGRGELTRELLDRPFPDSVRTEVEIETQ